MKHLSLLLIFAALLAVGCATVDNSGINVYANQIEKGRTDVGFTFEGAEDYQKAVITGSMNYKRERVEIFSETVDILPSVKLDVKAFGKWDFKIQLYSDNNKKVTITIENVPVISDEYKLAILNATFPVLLFTLDNITNGSEVPTAVMIERTDAYNWDNLPDSMYLMPLFPKSKNKGVKGSTFRNQMRPRMAEYVRQLEEISPGAEYTLYLVDNYPEMILQVMYLSGIPEGRSHFIMLSDGSGTYVLAEEALSGSQDEAKEKYELLLDKWNRAKEAALNGDGNCLKEIIKDRGSKALILQDYAAVIAAEEENVEWWVARKDLLYSGNDVIQQRIRDAATQIPLSDMVLSLDEEEKETLLSLYAFDSEMFGEADESGKSVMLFIGTRDDFTEGYHLEDYLTFVKSYYGENYEYYYKGHPAQPSDMTPKRAVILERTGWHEANSAIPAELILMYVPEINLCGYASTTFYSASPNHMFTLMLIKDSTIESTEADSSLGYLAGFDSIIVSNGKDEYLIKFYKTPVEGAVYGTWRPDTPDKVVYYDPLMSPL